MIKNIFKFVLYIFKSTNIYNNFTYIILKFNISIYKMRLLYLSAIIK